MTFGSGDARPEILAAVATKRTFYIERNGSAYTLVLAIEPGERMDQAMLERLMVRGITTTVDERIIAEQTISIIPADKSQDGQVHINADTSENAAYTVRGMDAILRGGRIAG